MAQTRSSNILLGRCFGGEPTWHCCKVCAADFVFAIVIGFAIAGLCGGRYFMKKLLDKLQVRPQVFAREEYKDCYSQYTSRKLSKPEAEAAKAYLQGWLHQIVSHIAADRSLHYDTVCRHKLSSLSVIRSCLNVWKLKCLNAFCSLWTLYLGQPMNHDALNALKWQQLLHANTRVMKAISWTTTSPLHKKAREKHFSEYHTTATVCGTVECLYCCSGCIKH